MCCFLGGVVWYKFSRGFHLPGVTLNSKRYLEGFL